MGVSRVLPLEVPSTLGWTTHYMTEAYNGRFTIDETNTCCAVENLYSYS